MAVHRPAARWTKCRRVSTEWQKGSLWYQAVVVKVSGDYDRCTYVVAVVLSLGRWNWFTGPGVQLNRRPMKTLGNRSWRELQTRHAEECQDVHNYRVFLYRRPVNVFKRLHYIWNKASNSLHVCLTTLIYFRGLAREYDRVWLCNSLCLNHRSSQTIYRHISLSSWHDIITSKQVMALESEENEGMYIWFASLQNKNADSYSRMQKPYL